MKTIRELKTLDWSGYIFKEMVNILDIKPEYFMVNDFNGCQNGSILCNFNVIVKKMVFLKLFLTILSVYLENVEIIVI